MAELNYRYSENEYLTFINYLLSNGFYLVSDVFRKTPDMIIIHSYKEMLRYWEWLKLNPHHGATGLYLMHDDYVKQPLLQKLSYNNQMGAVYTIRHRYGGPYIDLTYFSLVNAGTVGYYPYFYFDDIDCAQVKAPETLIQRYKDIAKYIRKTTTPIKYYNRKIYCGPEYLQMVIGESVKVEDEFKEIVREYSLNHDISDI